MGEAELLGGTVELAASEVEKECGRLASVIDLLKNGLDTPSDDLRSRVDRALRQVVDHERQLDGSMGVHQRLMEAAPHLYGRIRLLQTEHGTLTRTIRRLCESCRGSEDPEDIERLRQDLMDVVDKIERHRRATLDVIRAAREPERAPNGGSR